MGEVVAAMTLSYVVAALVLLFLVHSGDIWSQLSNTRLLGLLVRASIVRLTDAQEGLVPSIPDLQYYRASLDPVHWELVLAAAGVFLLFWLLKSIQFHDFTRYCGIEGSLGDHSRAYLYGIGINRFLPFNLGNLGTITALQAQGAELDRAAMAVFMGELFTLLEIVVFAFIALWLLGWNVWLSSLFWALVIAGGAYLLVRPRFGIPFRRRPGEPDVESFFDTSRGVLRVMAQRPGTSPG